jgi:hypothetical protein
MIHHMQCIRCNKCFETETDGNFVSSICPLCTGAEHAPPPSVVQDPPGPRTPSKRTKLPRRRKRRPRAREPRII